MQDLKYAEGAQLVGIPRDNARSTQLRLLASRRLVLTAGSGRGLGVSQMALQTTGEITVEVDRDTAFKFIEVPEQLAQCIPGCSDLRQTAPGSFTAVLTNEVSFMTLSFQVVVEVVKIDSSAHHRSQDHGKAHRVLRPVDWDRQTAPGRGRSRRTTIRHSSDIGLTGKLGGLGQPVFRAKSAEMTTKFGANLKAALEKNAARQKRCQAKGSHEVFRIGGTDYAG